MTHAEKKAEGKIRHYGFSFHSTPESVERILKAHSPEMSASYALWKYEPRKDAGELACPQHIKIRDELAEIAVILTVFIALASLSACGYTAKKMIQQAAEQIL